MLITDGQQIEAIAPLMNPATARGIHRGTEESRHARSTSVAPMFQAFSAFVVALYNLGAGIKRRMDCA